MPALETSSRATSREKPSLSTAFNAVRTALEQTQSEPDAFRSQQAVVETPNEIAVAMRLAGEAIATAARVAETELRKTRELLEQAVMTARRAEERAHLAEQRLGEWEAAFYKIRDDINGRLPPQQLAA